MLITVSLSWETKATNKSSLRLWYPGALSHWISIRTATGRTKLNDICSGSYGSAIVFLRNTCEKSEEDISMRKRVRNVETVTIITVKESRNKKIKKKLQIIIIKCYLPVLHVRWFYFRQPSHWMPCCLSLTGCLQNMQLSAILVFRLRRLR